MFSVTTFEQEKKKDADPFYAVRQLLCAFALTMKKHRNKKKLLKNNCIFVISETFSLFVIC